MQRGFCEVCGRSCFVTTQSEVRHMALCWECWKGFESDDPNARICKVCKHQRKLYIYMEDEEECPKGAEVKG